MNKLIKHTKDSITAEALKYGSRFEFQKKAKVEYNKALREGYLDEVCQHMQPIRQEWSFENVQLEAAKYSARTRFKEGSTCAYRAALREGWMDRVCSHMKPIGNLFKRCVYELRAGKKVYVGITYSLKARMIQHRHKKPLGTSAMEVVQLTDYIDAEEALKIERQLIRFNRHCPSLKSFNISDGGQLGGGVNNAL